MIIRKIIKSKLLIIASLILMTLVSSSSSRKNFLNSEIQEIITQLDNIFFKGACPKNITVKYAKMSNLEAFFDPKKNIIILSRNYFIDTARKQRVTYKYKNKNKLLAHEMCHLALNNLTKQQSIKEEFRFMDEGLAEIIGRQIAEPHELNSYKIKSIQLARSQIKNVSFKVVQKWDSFFGAFDDPNKNWIAYNVGASFIFFILDQYSKEKLYELFRSISQTGNLAKSIFDVFGKAENKLEAEWKKYIINDSHKIYSP